LRALHIWLMAARPRTLPAAVAPVLVGTALAATEGTFKILTFVAEHCENAGSIGEMPPTDGEDQG
jgi:hypothetical protein